MHEIKDTQNFIETNNISHSTSESTEFRLPLLPVNKRLWLDELKKHQNKMNVNLSNVQKRLKITLKN